MMDVVNLIIGIVSGVFTVASVILAIYCWILSAIKEDEKQFSDNKEELIQTLYSNIKELKEAEDTSGIVPVAERTNYLVERILHYQFWQHSFPEDNKKIKDFYLWNKYYISVLKRDIDKDKDSVFSVSLSKNEVTDLKKDFINKIMPVIYIFENWSAV